MILQLPTGGPETEQEINGIEGNCNNVDDEEEECWMRRTLAAHVDYIYTQKHNQPWALKNSNLYTFLHFW